AMQKHDGRCAGFTSFAIKHIDAIHGCPAVMSHKVPPVMKSLCLTPRSHQCREREIKRHTQSDELTDKKVHCWCIIPRALMKTSQKENNSDWRDGFLFLGNHLALDFVNTRPAPKGEPVELLTDFPTLLKWFQTAEVIDSADAVSLSHLDRDSEKAHA